MIPIALFQGDRIGWTDAKVPDDSISVTFWFRTNLSGAGIAATTNAANAEGVWEFELTDTQTSAMALGQWSWQAISTLATGPVTYDTGRIEVRKSFAYTGTPDAIDLRSQAQKDLEAVDEAIRVLISGAQSYTIGTAAGGRTFTRPMLRQLMEWRDRLIQQVARDNFVDGQTRRNRRILINFD